MFKKKQKPTQQNEETPSVPKKETKEDEELKQQIDEAITEAKFEEIEDDIIEALTQAEKEAEQMTNNELYEMLLSIKKDILNDSKKEFDMNNSIYKCVKKNIEISTHIDLKFNKKYIAGLVGFFTLGVLIGVQYELWTPYLSAILDFGRTIATASKG